MSHTICLLTLCLLFVSIISAEPADSDTVQYCGANYYPSVAKSCRGGDANGDKNCPARRKRAHFLAGGYLDNWLRGVGCVPLYNLMEDAATAEISRAQLWQMLRHDAKLDDGRTVDAQIIRETINAELERKLIRAGSVVSRLPDAAELLDKFAKEEHLSDFLTLDAYDKLVSEGY